MKKLFSIVLVCFFSAYLLSACIPPCLLSACIPPPPPPPPADPKQQALVIGNAEYKENELTNPVNDAKDMAKSLTKQGVNVVLHTNFDRKKMEDAIREFKNRLFAHEKSVGLFYFSGHGAQVDGKNYLIPINNDEIKSDDDVPWKAVQVEKVLAQMQGTNNGLNIIILDACRNKPYELYNIIQLSSKNSYRKDGLGLAPITPPEGVIIGYATAPGRTASDFSEGERNSLYTKYLLKAIESKKRIDDMFMQVRNDVLEESNGKQEPWTTISMNRPFCFGGCP